MKHTCFLKTLCVLFALCFAFGGTGFFGADRKQRKARRQQPKMPVFCRA